MTHKQIIRNLENVQESSKSLESDNLKFYKIKVKEEKELPYSQEDYELLAHLLMGEAGSEACEEEMVWLVGCVALNRVKSDKFPDTLKEVIFQEGQYQCVNDGNFDKEPTDRCWEIAHELLLYGSYIPDNVVFQAEFEQGSGTYKHIQNMYFCYE